jgi:hypothetical protein
VELWNPSDIRRAEDAERALRQELQRAWSSPDRQPRADEFDRQPADGAALPARPMTGAAKAEALLLRAALTEARWAEKVDATLGAESFLEEPHRCVAAAILGHTEGWEERLQVVWADPALTEVASSLLVVEEGPPLEDAQFEGALMRLVTRRKRQRMHFLEREALEGRIGKSDALYQEYLQLVNDLRGQGLKGEGESASRSNQGESGG